MTCAIRLRFPEKIVNPISPVGAGRPRPRRPPLVRPCPSRTPYPTTRIRAIIHQYLEHAPAGVRPRRSTLDENHHEEASPPPHVPAWPWRDHVASAAGLH